MARGMVRRGRGAWCRRRSAARRAPVLRSRRQPAAQQRRGAHGFVYELVGARLLQGGSVGRGHAREQLLTAAAAARWPARQRRRRRRCRCGAGAGRRGGGQARPPLDVADSDAAAVPDSTPDSAASAAAREASSIGLSGALPWSAAGLGESWAGGARRVRRARQPSRPGCAGSARVAMAARRGDGAWRRARADGGGVGRGWGSAVPSGEASHITTMRSTSDGGASRRGGAMR